MRTCVLSILLALVAGCATTRSLPVGSVADDGDAQLAPSASRFELKGHDTLARVELEVRRLAGRPTAVVSTHTHDGERHTTVLAPTAAIELLAVLDLSAPATLDLRTSPGARPTEAVHHPALLLRADGAGDDAPRLWVVDLEPDVAVVLDVAMVTGPPPPRIKKTTKKIRVRRTLRTLTLSTDVPDARATLHLTACEPDTLDAPACDTREFVYEADTAHYQLRRDEIIIY